MTEKLTEETISIGARYCRREINERQAIFLLATSGMSKEEAEIFLETLEYGVYVTSKVIIKIFAGLLLCFIAISVISLILFLVFK